MMINNVQPIILKESFDEWSQKLVAKISAMSVKVSASMYRLCSKDAIEEITDVEPKGIQK